MKVTKKKVEELLREIVAEKGADHVTKDCIYRNSKGAPVCMVGQVVGRLTDIPLTQVFPGIDKKHWRLGSNGDNFGEIVDKVEAKTGLAFTPKALTLLTAVQDRQDNYDPWGDVLDKVGVKR